MINDSLISYYKRLKFLASVRAQNALNRIESEFCFANGSSLDWPAFFDKYFLNPYNYLEIPKIGRKCSLELLEIKKKLVPHLETITQPSFNIAHDTEKDYLLQKYKNSDTLNLHLIDTYINFKEQCNVKIKNILASIEKDELVNTSLDKWDAYLSKYYLNDFNFLEIQMLGKKSLLDFKKLRFKLLETMKNLKIELTDENIEYDNLNSILEIHNLLNQKISLIKICKIIQNEKHPSFIIFCYLLLILNSNGRRARFIDYYYFNETIIKPQELSVLLECSFERVRQFCVSIENKLISDYWPKLSSLNIDSSIKCYDSTHFIKEIDFFDSKIELNGKHYIPNSRMHLLWFKLSVSKTHVNLIDELKCIPKHFKSFDFDNATFFIKKDLLITFDVSSFFEWADEEIFNFEKSYFEYDINVLVLRYFNERNLAYSKELSEALVESIKLIKKVNWPSNSIEKGIRKKWKETVLNNCIRYLNNHKKAATTADLLKFNIENKIDLKREELLLLLNKNKSIIIRIGNGNWQLNNENNDNQIKGSLRDIVCTILSQSVRPMHISEILEIIKQYRPINVHSLATNLKSGENNIFLLFNCSFYGIRSKKYDTYWYKLPKLSGGHLSTTILKIAENYNPENISKYFEDKYGYPSIHIKYLLERKNLK